VRPAEEAWKPAVSVLNALTQVACGAQPGQVAADTPGADDGDACHVFPFRWHQCLNSSIDAIETPRVDFGRE
jgi:hypothetical protein